MEYLNDEKRCSRCKEKKHIGEFQFQDRKREYLQSRCKVCDKLASKTSYQNNLSKNRKIRNNWQEQNRELHNKHMRAYLGRKRAAKREGRTWGMF